MTDNLTKKQRSRTMSKIRSRWTAQETRVHNWLKKNKIKHRMHPKIEGNPDIILPEKKLAIFLNGCFWHACLKCYIAPKTNKRYWLLKIKTNQIRDKKNSKTLRELGWKVKIIWEHQIKRNLDKACYMLVK